MAEKQNHCAHAAPTTSNPANAATNIALRPTQNSEKSRVAFTSTTIARMPSRIHSHQLIVISLDSTGNRGLRGHA
jgi:hypothetical protein